MITGRFRVLSMWSKWAGAVFHGIKTIETRTWPWPYPPGPLVIQASKKYDGSIPGRIDPFPTFQDVSPGHLVALVWVSGSRLLKPEDLNQSLVYRPGLYAWDLDIVFQLKPIQFKGPQKFSNVDAGLILSSIVGRV
jgi:hypothetical protein